MTDAFAPSPATVEQAHAYFCQRMQEGKAKHSLYLDQRGLSFIEPKHHGRIGLAIPDDGSSVPDKVLLKAVY